MMTREEAIEALCKAKINSDTEEAHMLADDILCDLLVSLGYRDVVVEWRKVDKWYA